MLDRSTFASSNRNADQTSGTVSYTHLVSYYLIPMANKANVPVVIHLYHGLKKETCLKALELGFSSIMYDLSLIHI